MKRGTSLIELIFVVGLGLVILSVGYKAYFAISLAGDYQKKREEMMQSAQNLMSRIKRDVRAARAVSAAGESLALAGEKGVTYRSVDSGVQRKSVGGTGLTEGIHARFLQDGGGVNITLTSESRIHRRPVRIEISSYVSPRG